MWDLPRPGLEPVSPALAGRFSTTAPPGKSLFLFLNDRQGKNWNVVWLWSNRTRWHFLSQPAEYCFIPIACLLADLHCPNFLTWLGDDGTLIPHLLLTTPLTVLEPLYPFSSFLMCIVHVYSSNAVHEKHLALNATRHCFHNDFNLIFLLIFIGV